MHLLLRFTSVQRLTVLSCSVLSYSVTPWIAARQASLSIRILQARILGLPCPPPGDLSNPGIKPRSPALQADSLPSEPPEKHYKDWKKSHIQVTLPKKTFFRRLTLLQKSSRVLSTKGTTAFTMKSFHLISCLRFPLITGLIFQEGFQHMSGNKDIHRK